MIVFDSNAIHSLEKDHIEKHSLEPMALMIKATTLFANWVDKKFTKDGMSTAIICGWGNNGADGYCIAEILRTRNEIVHVFEIENESQSALFLKAKKTFKGDITIVKSINDLAPIASFNLTVDAILGIGINREPSEDLSIMLEYINQHANHIMSVDIPSGMFPDAITDSTSILAHETMTFTAPKLSFFSKTNEHRLGKWIINDIGLDKQLITKYDSSIIYIDREYIQGRLLQRDTFSHKGDYGHLLLIGGSYGMAGSITLASKAAYRCGSGLVTIGSCDVNRLIIQTSLIESMFMSLGEQAIDQFLFPEKTYDAIGIGPGLGTSELTILSFAAFLESNTETLVLDADALNIIAKLQLQEKLVPGSILTPHPKEFDRLFGEHDNDFDRRATQISKSKELGIYIILKGAYTSISIPEGKLFYNSTGNPGMATGGSGDILLGMICSFIGQGYNNEESCLLAVYVHGLSGDITAKELGESYMIASDIIDRFSISFNMIK